MSSRPSISTFSNHLNSCVHLGSKPLFLCFPEPDDILRFGVGKLSDVVRSPPSLSVSNLLLSSSSSSTGSILLTLSAFEVSSSSRSPSFELDAAEELLKSQQDSADEICPMATILMDERMETCLHAATISR